MENKTFVFVSSWVAPLRKLSLEQRWNVMEAILGLALEGESNQSLSPIEDMAFSFIRGDIERMQTKYKSVCQKRRQAAKSRWNCKDNTESNDCKSNVCSEENYKEDTYTNTDTNTNTDTETTTTSSPTSTGVRVRGNAGKETDYDDSQLLERFFDSPNQAKLEGLAMKHHLSISQLKTMAEEITIQWALSDKTHDSYQDASLHLQYALAEKANRERKSRLQAIAEGAFPAADAKGMLGIDEYIDSEGRRTYNGVDFIPNDAPPRPGRAFWWNRTTNSWDDIQ